MAKKTISIDLLISTAKSVQSTEAQRAILLDIYEALKDVEKGSTAFDTLTEAANGLKDSLGGVNASFEDIYGEIQPLTSRLGEMEDRMYELALAGQQNTQEFKDLQAEAIKMRKTIIDVDDSVDAFAQKGAKIKAFSGIVSGLAGAFGTAQAAVGLFGGDTEGFEKSLLKLQQVMVIMQGVQEVSNLLTEKNIILEKIANFNRGVAVKLVGEKTVATAAEAVATGTATLAQRALNVAMSANPIGLLIVGIGTLIGLYSAFGDETEDNEEKQKEYNDQLARTKKLNDELRLQGLELSSIQKQGAIDEKERALENEKDLNKQKTLIKEIGTLKKEQIEIDRQKFKADEEKIKQTQETIKKLDKSIEKTEADIEKRRNFLNEAAIDRELKYVELRRKGVSEEAAEAQTNVGWAIKSGQRDLTLFEETTQKKEKVMEEFAEATGINYKDIEKKQRANAKEQLKIDETANQKKLATDAETKKRLKEAEEKAAEEAKKRADEAAKIEEDRRKKILEGINDILARQKSANAQLKDISLNDIKELEKKELEYQSIKYGDDYQKVIDTAISRELKNNEELYLTRKISLETFQKNREDITKNGVKYVIAEEQKVLDAITEQNEKIKTAIKNRFADEATLTRLETIKIKEDIKALDLKYAKDAELVATNSIVNVEERANAVLAINKKYADREKENRQTLYDAELNLLREKYAQEIKLAEEQYGKDSDKVKNLKEKQALDELRLEKEKNKEIIAITKETTSEKIDILKKEEDVRKKLVDELISLEQKLQDATLSIYNNIIDQKLKANDMLYQDTIEKIDAEENAFNEQFITRTALEQAKYDAQLSFQAKRDNAERKRQLEEDKLNKKRFNAQKLNDIATATINTSIAVTKTIAELGGVGAITPPGAALIAAVIAGGAVEVGAIGAQKYIPTYAKGGLVKGAGTGTSDSIDAKLSNGEVVINQKSAAAFAPLLDAINQAGGGAAIPYVKKPMKPMANKAESYDFKRLEEAIMTLNDRPIETFVNEKTITTAQMRARKLNDRTSF